MACNLVKIIVVLIILLPLGADAELHSYYENLGKRENLGRGHINLSAFVYFDVNRNGVYDIPDRPMSSIVVTVCRQTKWEF